uniref:Uncharacterized protein n=1 Tax=Glossina austeni TaxID=7395 RepID=A0A1A9VGX0_GLOAU
MMCLHVFWYACRKAPVDKEQAFRDRFLGLCFVDVHKHGDSQTQRIRESEIGRLTDLLTDWKVFAHVSLHYNCFRTLIIAQNKLNLPVFPGTADPPGFVMKFTTLLFLIFPLVMYISNHRRYLVPGFKSIISVPVVLSRLATLKTLESSLPEEFGSKPSKSNSICDVAIRSSGGANICCSHLVVSLLGPLALRRFLYNYLINRRFLYTYLMNLKIKCYNGIDIGT